MSADELKEDLLEKAIHCKCDEFLLEIDDEFIKELGEDVVISFADIGVDGNSITIHYDRFCPAIHSFSLDGIKVDE